MRQVPENLNYLLIGEGRLARHLACYFEHLGILYSQWNRNDGSTGELIRLLKSHDHTLLCINDDQIEHFYSQFSDSDRSFIHFSGSLVHPEVKGFHPLMSFGHSLYSYETYKHIHFSGLESIEVFQQCFPQLSNTYSQISPEQLGFYHSLCVLGGNGTTLLWDLVGNEFEKLGLPEQALEPFLKNITENIINKNPGRWSGPWYRNDKDTISRNKDSLKSGPLENLYIEMEKLSLNSGHHNEKRS